MTLGPISTSTAHHSSAQLEAPGAAEQDPTTSIALSDPMLALAALLIESDHLRGELDHQNLQAARNAQQEAMARQISALHEAADDVRTGALVEGALTAGGAVLSGISTVCSAEATSPEAATNAKLLGQAGGAMHDMAGPAGKLAGDAPRMDAEADVKQAENEASQAAFLVADAQDHQQRVADHSDRILDQLAQLIETEHAGNLAILANS